MALVMVSSAVPAPLLRAQAQAAKQAPRAGAGSQTTSDVATFTLNARLVVLDVVVSDKSGRLVDGLTARDFQVFEDGQPQRIRSFEPPSQQVLPLETAKAGISAVFDPAQPSGFGRAPVTILVLDQLNTHFADSSFARRCLRDYLLSQPAMLAEPTTLLTVYDNHFKLLQGFTRDRDALLRALAAAPVKYAWKLEVNGKTEYGPVERLDQSLRALEEIAQSSARIPGRKNLVWVGVGFPTINPTTIDGDDAQEVKEALRHLTDVLLATHVTLNAVDPSSQAAGMTEVTDTSQMDFLEAAGDALSGSFDPFGASDDFDRLAPMTGGRVVRGKNDIAGQIGAAVDLAAHSYTIAYSPVSANESAAQFRKIRVVCLRPGTSTATRSGYYADEGVQESSPATAAYDLTTAAETAIPLNGVRVQVEPGSAAGNYLVHAGAPNLTWKLQGDGSSTASVYVMAVSLDGKGRMLGHTLHGMTATARAGTNLNDPAKLADFFFSAQALPRAATLRFIVRDNASGRMGSFDLPLKAR